MSKIACVKIRHSGKIIRLKSEKEKLASGDFCIVPSVLGGELGIVVNESPVVCDHYNSKQDIPKVIRKATKKDLEKFEQLREKERKAFEFCLEKIKARELPMKLVAVRYFFSERKGIFYYTAEGRIDFRELVKDLAKELKMRIEMRQIGVRDEAKMIGGLGVCGRTLCCFSFMKAFEPVTIQKAKEQQIAINPTKISGLCGRLMCCLTFEAESRGRMYVEEEEIKED
ncbi:MAG: stage 0 sporulation family protein [Candidatus Aminicenantia bacterium]